MKGVYQHCSEDHLHRYLSESSSATRTAPSSAYDVARADVLAARIVGKRLTYRRTNLGTNVYAEDDPRAVPRDAERDLAQPIVRLAFLGHKL
jgi:hypothetical protein